MRRVSLLLIILTLSLCQQACQNRQQADSQASESTAAVAEAGPSASTGSSFTGHLAELGLTENSDWRGINLGDDFAKVKATEKTKPFENDDSHVGYTVEFNNLETADMLYYQTNQKVSAIDVDLFLNSRQSVDAYQSELSGYFTTRYGTPKPGNGGTVWTGKNKETVTMKDVSKGKDFGLKVKFAPAGGGTASMR